ncbi:MAG: hypothetical protein LBC13_01200 [Clostridiales bacterium]|nr:hypothetical protein [Clostridiales bacterium]
MKKRISLILLTVLALASAIAFAACNDDDVDVKLEQNDFSLSITSVYGSTIALGEGPYSLRALGSESDSNRALTVSIVRGGDVIRLDKSETGEWTITPLALGDAELTATRAGDDNYNAKTVKENLTITVVNPAPPPILFPTNQSLLYQRWVPGGFTFEIAASGGGGDGAFRYEVIDGPATVTGSTVHVTGTTKNSLNPDDPTLKDGILMKAVKAASGIYEESEQICMIKILRAEQEPLELKGVTGKHAHSDPFDLEFAEYENGNKKSGSGTGAYVYTVDSGALKIEYPASPAVSVTGRGVDGVAYVTVTREGDYDYEPAAFTLRIDIAYTEQEELIISAYSEVTYAPNSYIEVEATGGSGSGKYEIVVDSQKSTVIPEVTINEKVGDIIGRLSVPGAGTIVVRAIKKGGDGYADAISEDLTIIVNKAQQDPVSARSVGKDFSFTNGLKVYLIAEGGSSSNDYRFRITEGAELVSEAILGADNFLTGNKDDGGAFIAVVGAGTIKFRAVKPGDGNYEDAESDEVTVVVDKGVQSELSFDESYYSVAYGTNGSPTETVSVIAKGGESSVSVVYTLGDGSCLTATDDAGVFGINGTGTATVTAYRPGDDNWNESVAVSVQVDITKGTQAALTLSLPKGLVPRYGGENFEFTVTGGTGDGEISLTVADETVIKLTNDNGWKAKIVAPGAVRVTAAKAGDGNWESVTAELSVKVGKALQTVEVNGVDLNTAPNGSNDRGTVLTVYKSENEADFYLEVTVSKDNAGFIPVLEYSGMDISTSYDKESGSFKAKILWTPEFAAMIAEGDAVHTVSITAKIDGNDYYEAAESETFTLNIVDQLSKTKLQKLAALSEKYDEINTDIYTATRVTELETIKTDAENDIKGVVIGAGETPLAALNASIKSVGDLYDTAIFALEGVPTAYEEACAALEKERTAATKAKEALLNGTSALQGISESEGKDTYGSTWWELISNYADDPFYTNYANHFDSGDCVSIDGILGAVDTAILNGTIGDEYLNGLAVDIETEFSEIKNALYSALAGLKAQLEGFTTVKAEACAEIDAALNAKLAAGMYSQNALEQVEEAAENGKIAVNGTNVDNGVFDGVYLARNMAISNIVSVPVYSVELTGRITDLKALNAEVNASLDIRENEFSEKLDGLQARVAAMAVDESDKDAALAEYVAIAAALDVIEQKLTTQS